jgi:hypothetical protein
LRASWRPRSRGGHQDAPEVACAPPEAAPGKIENPEPERLPPELWLPDPDPVPEDPAPELWLPDPDPVPEDPAPELWLPDPDPVPEDPAPEPTAEPVPPAPVVVEPWAEPGSAAATAPVASTLATPTPTVTADSRLRPRRLSIDGVTGGPPGLLGIGDSFPPG